MRYFLLILFSLFILFSCQQSKDPTSANGLDGVYDFNITPEEETIEAIDDIIYIHDWALSQLGLKKPAADTIYVNGDTIMIGVDSVGVIKTEKHQVVKGFPLITLRLNHGASDSATTTLTKRFVSDADLAADNPSDTRRTTVRGVTGGWIETVSVKDGIQSTYSFKSPIRTIKGNIETVRYGLPDNRVVTETWDTGVLQRTRYTFGLPSGATVTRTFYPDSTWAQTETIGRSNGYVVKIYTENP